MRLETYLDAMESTYHLAMETPVSNPLFIKYFRQHEKFRQHILDCSIFYQRKDVPYYIAEMASLIKKPPIRKPEKQKK